MVEENHAGESIIEDHYLELSENDTEQHCTIYKLTQLLMRRFSPSPAGVARKEVRDLLQRLEEIDNESRELLSKVFSLLEKDETTLENYVKEKIENPKVSRMWQLVEQVLACQDEVDNNLDELIINDDISDYSIKERDEMGEVMKSDRFKVKSIGSGSQASSSSTTSSMK